MSDEKKNEVTATALRRKLREALKTVELGNGPVHITRHGKTVAILTSPVVAQEIVVKRPESGHGIEVVSSKLIHADGSESALVIGDVGVSPLPSAAKLLTDL